MKTELTAEQKKLYDRLAQSRRNGTGLILSDPASVGILHQTITLPKRINNRTARKIQQKHHLHRRKHGKIYLGRHASRRRFTRDTPHCG